MNIDFEDIKVRIILVGSILLIGTLFLNKQEVLECKSKHNYCTIKSTNIYNMTKTTKLFIASNISGTNVRSYKYRTGSRHHRRVETRYQLDFISQSRERKNIFSNYYKHSTAVNVGNKIMRCLKTENYPCIISKY